MTKNKKSKKERVQELRDKLIAPVLEIVKEFPNLSINRMVWSNGSPELHIVFTVSEEFINKQVELVQAHLRNNKIGVSKVFNFTLFNTCRQRDAMLRMTLNRLDEDLQDHIAEVITNGADS